MKTLSGRPGVLGVNSFASMLLLIPRCCSPSSAITRSAPPASSWTLLGFLSMHSTGRLSASICLDNLISAGVLGLMDAIAKDDSTRGTTCKTYSVMSMYATTTAGYEGGSWYTRCLLARLAPREGWRCSLLPFARGVLLAARGGELRGVCGHRMFLLGMGSRHRGCPRLGTAADHVLQDMLGTDIVFEECEQRRGHAA